MDDSQTAFLIWVIQMVVLYFIIKGAMNNSKIVEELKSLRKLIEDHIERESCLPPNKKSPDHTEG